MSPSAPSAVASRRRCSVLLHRQVGAWSEASKRPRGGRGAPRRRRASGGWKASSRARGGAPPAWSCAPRPRPPAGGSRERPRMLAQRLLEPLPDQRPHPGRAWARRRAVSSPLDSSASRAGGARSPRPPDALAGDGARQQDPGPPVLRAGRSRCRACWYSIRARFAAGSSSPSALLTTRASASSSTPFLMPCSSSPAPGWSSTRKKSTIEATVASDCPTPRSRPSPRRSPPPRTGACVSRVRWATPPSEPPRATAG
jgi:hypothetical protein